MLERQQCRSKSIVHPMDSVSELNLCFAFSRYKTWGVLVTVLLSVTLEYSAFLKKVQRAGSDFSDAPPCVGQEG